jgi:hypothetical protein
MRITLSLAVMAALATASFGQNFVNGGFETGDLTGWTITPTANGQTTTQTVATIDIDGPGSLGPSLAGKFSVGQVNFQSGQQAGIELTQALTLTSGQTYTFSFNWAAIVTGVGQSNAQGGVFSLIVNGNVLATGAAGSTSDTIPKYGFLTANFTAGSSGAHIVGARITRPFTVPGSLNQYVDNFTAVPEPATMLALGMGAVALLRRRRK